MSTADFERDIERERGKLAHRVTTLEAIEEAKRQRGPMVERPKPAIRWESAPGGFTAESSFHGALVDLLEGVGVVSVLPGVVDVPGLNGGPSLLEADRDDLFDALAVAGWDPACRCGRCEFWEWASNNCEPLMIGEGYALLPAL